MKTTKIVLLAMLCVASASCVELENICPSDTFKFREVLVNAFHRVEGSVTFRPMTNFLVDDSVKCDFFEFKNKENFWGALKIKQA